MATIAELKADMEAKRKAYEAAQEAHHAAECAAFPVQPGDLIEVTSSRRIGPHTYRRAEVKALYRVKRLTFGYTPKVYAAKIRADGTEGVEKHIWRDYRKVEEK